MRKFVFSAAKLMIFFVVCCMFMMSCDSPLFRTATAPDNKNLPAETSDTADTTDVYAPVTSTVPVTTDAADTADVTTAPPEPDVRKASFLGAGDIIIYYGNVRDAKSCAAADGRTYNFAPMFANVADRIASADIAFVNQETLMCGDGFAFSYYPHFNGPQDLGYDIKEVGFDVVNIANNHMLDKGESGLAATIDFWNSMDGITMIGGYKDQNDYETVRIVETNGIRVAFLAYTYFTNYLSLPADSPLVVPYFDEEAAVTQLARAKELADFVIVSVHWDAENTFTPTQIERDFASLLADNGADAIIGHHPHVIQPVEWIEREDGGRTLCAYSLGNFAAEMARDYNMLGGMITFDMVLTDGVPAIDNVEFIPTVYYFNSSFYKNQVYFLSDFTDDLAKSHGISYYGNSITLDGINNYLKNTVSEEFLPKNEP